MERQNKNGSLHSTRGKWETSVHADFRVCWGFFQKLGSWHLSFSFPTSQQNRAICGRWGCTDTCSLTCQQYTTPRSSSENFPTSRENLPELWANFIKTMFMPHPVAGSTIATTKDIQLKGHTERYSPSHLHTLGPAVSSHHHMTCPALHPRLPQHTIPHHPSASKDLAQDQSPWTKFPNTATSLTSYLAGMPSQDGLTGSH